MLADSALSDEAQDLLGFKSFSEALSGVIDSPNTSTPLVMAINAKWGAGKTTLGKMVKRRLETKPAADSYTPHVTCWFNSWMHDNASSLGAALAAEVARCANGNRSVWRRLISPLPANLIDARQRKIRKGLTYFGLLILFMGSCLAVSIGFGFTLSDVVKSNPKVINTLASLPGGAYITALLVALVLLFKGVASVLPAAKSVSEFVNDPQSVKNTVSMREVRAQLGKLIKQGTPRKSKFVIFVDDLDRCRPPRPVDLLEIINQLLDHGAVVVLLMMDTQVIAKCAEIRYKSLGVSENATGPGPARDSSIYGWNYLQKIIQLQFDLPAYPIAEIRKMIENLAKVVPNQKRRGLLSALLAGSASRVRGLASRILATRSRYSEQVAMATIILILIQLFWSLWDTAHSQAVAKHPILMPTLLSALTALLAAEAVLLYFNRARPWIRTLRRRREIDQRIRAEVARGERELAAVERSIIKAHPAWSSDPATRLLLTERVQRYLEDESELQREAEAEVVRHLEPFPRHAKRLLNRLRLLLFVAHTRKMFGGVPQLTARHIGKWAVLCERWPELAQAIYEDPEITPQLENPRTYPLVLKQRAPLYEGDEELQEFCQSTSEVRLSPCIKRIIAYSPAEKKS